MSATELTKIRVKKKVEILMELIKTLTDQRGNAIVHVIDGLISWGKDFLQLGFSDVFLNEHSEYSMLHPIRFFSCVFE